MMINEKIMQMTNHLSNRKINLASSALSSCSIGLISCQIKKNCVNLNSSNPNQHHEAHWANEWHQYKYPTKENIVLNQYLSKNQPPQHESALRADFCSFWLDYIPKLTSATGLFDCLFFPVSIRNFIYLFFFLNRKYK